MKTATENAERKVSDLGQSASIPGMHADDVAAAIELLGIDTVRKLGTEEAVMAAVDAELAELTSGIPAARLAEILAGHGATTVDDLALEHVGIVGQKLRDARAFPSIRYAFAETVKAPSSMRKEPLDVLAKRISDVQPVPQKVVDQLIEAGYKGAALAKEIKVRGVAIAFGVFPDGARTRTKDNAEGSTGTAFDFDGRSGDTTHRDDVLAAAQAAGAAVLIWETYSSTDDGLTFRAVFPHDTIQPIDGHPARLRLIAEQLGFAPPHGGLSGVQHYFVQPRLGRSSICVVVPGACIDSVLDFSTIEVEPEPAKEERPKHTHGSTLTAEQYADAMTVIDAMHALGLHKDTGKAVWHRVIGALALYGEQGEALALRFSEGGCPRWREDTLKKIKDKLRNGAVGIANLFAIAAEFGIPNPASGRKLGAAEDFGEADERGAPPPKLTPPPLPDPFPGAHTAIVKAMKASMYIVQDDLANLAALVAMASALHGLYRYPDGFRCNLYGALLADTAEGKESPMNTAQVIAKHCGVKTLSQPASGEALEDQLVSGQGILALLYEAGHVFSVLAGKNAAPHHVSLAKNLLDVFTAGARVYEKRARAGIRGQAPVAPEQIPHPTVSALLASTPDKLGAALSEDNIKDGLLGRILFGFGRPDAPLNEEAVDFYTTSLDFVTLDTEDTNGLIQWSTEADAARRPIERASLARRRELSAKEDSIGAALLGRSFDKAKRIAGVLAVWSNPKRPVVTTTMLNWAMEFVKASDDGLKVFIAKYMHDTQVHKNATKIVEAMRKVAAGGIKPQQFAQVALCRHGHLPRSLVMKASRLTPKDFDDALRLLEETAQAGQYPVKYHRGVNEQSAQAIGFSR